MRDTQGLGASAIALQYLKALHQTSIGGSSPQHRRLWGCCRTEDIAGSPMWGSWIRSGIKGYLMVVSRQANFSPVFQTCMAEERQYVLHSGWAKSENNDTVNI